MCAVVTVGAVVGPTCGACAARARRWPTAYRRVPKRCAPKVGDFLVHKDNQSGDFCLLCAEKASSSLQISFIRRHFLLFIVHSSTKTRKPYRPRWEKWHRKRANTGANRGGDARVGGSSGKPTVSGEATRRYFTLSHTAARDARRVPASSSPRTVTDGARLSILTILFAHDP